MFTKEEVVMSYKNFIFSVFMMSSFCHLAHPMIHTYTSTQTPSVKHTPTLGIGPHPKTFCKNDTLLKDIKEFAQNMAQFTYREPLLVCSDEQIPGKPNILFLQERNPLENEKIKTEKFVLKMYDKYEETSAIKEAIGSHIGTSAGIPINKVKIIPPSQQFTGKTAARLATLHTYMPGKEAALADAPSFYIKETLGNRGGLDAAAYSKDLADIIAIDIFVNNGDRNKLNYFFDEKTGRYYGIDLGQSFTAAIPAGSMAHISFVFLSKLTTISENDKKGLTRVNRRLKQLLQLYPVSTLYDLWMEKAQEAEYRYSDFKKKKIKNKIVKLNGEVKKLVDLIDTLVR